MFKYKFYEFFNKENEVLTIQFENTKFLIGEFFSESYLELKGIHIIYGKKKIFKLI